MTPQVLVVGAGPTGLVLACELAWRGVAVRLVDAAAGPSRYPKAVGVLPRTLELLEQHGVVEEMVACGRPFDRLEIHGGSRGEKTLGHFDFGRLDCAYPYLLSLPQAETERILLRRAGELGVGVEWGTRVTAVSQPEDRLQVVVELSRPGRSGGGTSEQLDVPWLAACDGAHSAVRDAIGIPFTGARIEQAFNLADATVADVLPGDRTHLFMADDGILFMVPLPDPAGENRFYIIMGEEPGSAGRSRPDPTIDQVRAVVGARAAVLAGVAPEEVVTNPRTLGRFRIQRYLAGSFAQRRVFLVGDAAHVHPPSGAQGMNSGIQDAVNLGWKLASVVGGQAPVELLDSYDAERRPLARTVQSGAYGILRAATVQGRWRRAVRDRALRAALTTPAVHRRLVDAEAGLAIRYRDADSRSTRARRTPAAGAGLRPGDRAPDVRLGPDGGPGARRLYEALRHPGHTLLVLTGARGTGEDLAGAVRFAEDAARRHPSLVVRVVTGQTPPAVHAPSGELVLHDPAGAVAQRYTGGRAGHALLRPDRYLALVGLDHDAARLDSWLAAHQGPGPVGPVE